MKAPPYGRNQRAKVRREQEAQSRRRSTYNTYNEEGEELECMGIKKHHHVNGTAKSAEASQVFHTRSGLLNTRPDGRNEAHSSRIEDTVHQERSKDVVSCDEL